MGVREYFSDPSRADGGGGHCREDPTSEFPDPADCCGFAGAGAGLRDGEIPGCINTVGKTRRRCLLHRVLTTHQASCRIHCSVFSASIPKPQFI